MTQGQARPLAQIQKAADALKQRQPDMVVVLSFYENMFQAQEAEKRQVGIEPIILEDAAVAQKLSAKAPLLAPCDFRFDPSSCERMLRFVCRLIQNSDNAMADSARAVWDWVEHGKGIEALFDNLLKENDAYFNRLSSQINAEKAAIAYIAYHSMRPSLTVCSGLMAEYLGDDQDINSQNCAVCGHRPGIATFDTDGRRQLACRFCEHRWVVRRVFCPFCGQTDGHQLRYIYTESDSEYRIDVCHQCRHYLKTIDSRQTERPLYLPLEQVASLHLDLYAQRQGYQGAVAFSLEPA